MKKIRCACTLLALSWIPLGCGDFEIVVPRTLSATIAPSHGSVETSRDVEIFVSFSDTIGDANSALDDIELRCLGTPPCQTPNANGCNNVEFPVLSGTFVASNTTARLTPDEPLLSDTCYVITVEAGIEAADSDLGPIPTAVTASFQTR